MAKKKTNSTETKYYKALPFPRTPRFYYLIHVYLKYFYSPHVQKVAYPQNTDHVSFFDIL